METTVDTVESLDGTTIAYERIGAGPALILVDAACCFRGFGPMASLADALAADFTVFRYDRRGRGESTDTLPYAVDREVEDLQALIDTAGGSALVHGFSSGAVLAMHAALRGVAIPGLSLLEPALDREDRSAEESDLEKEVRALLADGRRGDAIVHINESIGVPQEMIDGMRESPAWPSLEALAHTFLYDGAITRSMHAGLLSAIIAPVLVISSEASDEQLRTWAAETADGLPNGTHRVLPGEWHGVPDGDLAAALTGFFTAPS